MVNDNDDNFFSNYHCYFDGSSNSVSDNHNDGNDKNYSKDYKIIIKIIKRIIEIHLNCDSNNK